MQIKMCLLLLNNISLLITNYIVLITVLNSNYILLTMLVVQLVPKCFLKNLYLATSEN
jgi:hypothetical protein